MLDNNEAIKLTWDARREEIISRLNDYKDEDLFCICRDAFSYDGSFDFVDCFDATDIDEYLCDMKPYDVMCRVFFGNVNSISNMLRFDAYGNLESVHEFELYDECRDRIDEIADWLIDDWQNTDSLYEEDKELFDAWDDIDNDRYDWDEDEEE